MAQVSAEVSRDAPRSPGYPQRSERNALACGPRGLHAWAGNATGR